MKTKKMLAAFTAFSALILAGCGTTESKTVLSVTPSSASTSSLPQSRSESASAASLPQSAPESSAAAESKDIKVASWKLSKDYNGKDVLVIEYEWTNTETEAANFMTTFTDTVYQNGVECSSTVIGCDDVDAQKQMNDVKPGVTYNIAVGYLLQDKTDANVVVKKLFGDEVINETVELGGGSGTTATSGDVAKTSVKIAEHSLSKDYNGEDVLVVTYEFYNGEDSAKSFTFLFADKAFQNGVECDSTVIGCKDVDAQAQLNDIQTGTSYAVSVGYHISDMSDVEIEVKDLFGSKTYLTETVKLS